MSEPVLSQHPGTSQQLVQFPVNTIGRDFAVGDVHGCFSALQRALDAVGFHPVRDRLFSVGDLVDRGPESQQVLEWLDKPWFHAIGGNHEQMVVCSAAGMPMHDVDHMRHGGAWLLDVPAADRLRIGRRLAALPLAMEVATPKGPVGLVHADYPFDDWNVIRQQELNATAVDACLWSRARYARQYSRIVANVRAVVHGHTSLNQVEILGNVFYIDTGGWRRGPGHFTLLNLHTLLPHKGPSNRVEEPVAAAY